MGAKYRNVGAPFSSGGVKIHKGVTFEPTAEDLKRRGYKLEYVSGTLSPGQGVAGAASEAPEEDCGCNESETEPDDGTRTVEDYHTGGGWYTLPGGVRVRGRDAALGALSGQG